MPVKLTFDRDATGLLETRVQTFTSTSTTSTSTTVTTTSTSTTSTSISTTSTSLRLSFHRDAGLLETRYERGA